MGNDAPQNLNLNKMKNFKVEFSNKYEKEFGTRFHTKLVRRTSDPRLGIESTETYYLWGTTELEGIIELDLEDYVIKEESHIYKGDTIYSKRIMGLR